MIERGLAEFHRDDVLRQDVDGSENGVIVNRGHLKGAYGNAVVREYRNSVGFFSGEECLFGDKDAFGSSKLLGYEENRKIARQKNDTARRAAG